MIGGRIQPLFRNVAGKPTAALSGSDVDSGLVEFFLEYRIDPEQYRFRQASVQQPGEAVFFTAVEPGLVSLQRFRPEMPAESAQDGETT